MHIQPTFEGVRRYPATQGYHPDLSAPNDSAEPDLESPCTCTHVCPTRCSGACGCPACSLSFAVFADEAGFLDVEAMSDEREAEAVARYQGT